MLEESEVSDDELGLFTLFDEQDGFEDYQESAESEDALDSYTFFVEESEDVRFIHIFR